MHALLGQKSGLSTLTARGMDSKHAKLSSHWEFKIEVD
jgi:hypothetical protein